MRIIGIVAVDEEYGIARDSKIPWRNSRDLRFFREITTSGHNPSVVMGRKTFVTIGHALPNRTNYVLTTNIPKSRTIERDEKDTSEIHFLSSPEPLLTTDATLYIIGGRNVYKWFADRNLYDEFYVSRIKGRYGCDIFINAALVWWRFHDCAPPSGLV